jgi:hypothetical protein
MTESPTHRVVDILRDLLNLGGIQVKGSISFYKWVGYTQEIETTRQLARVLGDGQYFLDMDQVTVVGVGLEPLEMGHLDANLSLTGGEWACEELYEEEFDIPAEYPSPERIPEMIEKIKGKIVEAVRLLTKHFCREVSGTAAPES